jgi:putative FmdB family regulatory protein
MPLYEYECDACGRRFELIRKFSDPPVDVCTLCGRGPVNRLQSSPAIQFKGSGWYITDYAKKGEGGKGEGGKEGKGEGGKPEGGPSDGTKSDATTAEAGTKSDLPAKAESSKPAAPAKTGGGANND